MNTPFPGPVSQPVRVPWTLDDGPGRYRIGLIALATDHATERDFTNMRPSDDVAVFVSRVHNENPCTPHNLRRMAPRLTEAAALILPHSRLDVIAYSCTSGTVTIGHEAVAERFRAAHPEAACVTPVSAALAAFESFAARRVAVLTPYLDEVNGPLRDCLEQHGVQVVAMSSFGIADDNDMARLPPRVIRDAAVEADHPDAEALFVSSTAVRAAEVAAAVEQRLGKPVVTSIQALFWRSLRLAGCSASVDGYGRLLQRPPAALG